MTERSQSTDELIAEHRDELYRRRYTTVESAAIGGLKGLSGGFADEGIAVLKTGAKLAAGGLGLSDLAESYRKHKRETQREFQRADEDNPKSFLGGEIVGAAGIAAVPGLGWVNIAKGAGAVSKLKTAAKIGAVIGAGTSDADLTRGEVANLADDMAQGAILGAAVQGGLSAGGGVIGGIANRFKTFPETRAVKAATGQNISALRQITGTTLQSPGSIEDATKKIVKVGRDILKEPDVLTPLSSVEDIAPRITAAREKYGKLIGSVGDDIDTMVPKSVDAKHIANDIVDYAAKIPPTESGKTLQTRLMEEAKNFEDIGLLSFADAQLFKNQFRYKPVDADALISNQDATNAVRRIIKREMERTADRFQRLDEYLFFKSKFGSFKAAEGAATDRVQKNITNRFISPSDYGIGAAAGIANSFAAGSITPTSVLIGTGAALGNKFARERGSALAAKTADAILKAFETDGVKGLLEASRPVLEAARKGNPAAILTFQILDQSNPRAIELLNQQDAMKRRSVGE